MGANNYRAAFRTLQTMSEIIVSPLYNYIKMKFLSMCRNNIVRNEGQQAKIRVIQHDWQVLRKSDCQTAMMRKWMSCKSVHIYQGDLY